MKQLDIDALLKKNPQVDKAVIKRHLEKLKDEGGASHERRPGSASPYAGRRMIVDETAEPDEGCVSRTRSHYGSI